MRGLFLLCILATQALFGACEYLACDADATNEITTLKQEISTGADPVKSKAGDLEQSLKDYLEALKTNNDKRVILQALKEEELAMLKRLSFLLQKKRKIVSSTGVNDE